MKRVLIVLDDETAKELAKSRNMSATVRDALRVYNSHISTDTFTDLKWSYDVLRKTQLEHFEKMNERMDRFEEAFARMDRLISVLETRM